MAAEDTPFEPLAILATLERHRVAYVVIGAVARVIHGTDEITSGLDICPQRREANERRLTAALAELGADGADGVLATARLEPIAFETTGGELQLVFAPTGAPDGYDDLRRAATHEPLGGGIRAPIASVRDLIRMASALGRAADNAHLAQLRRLQELGHVRAPER